MNVQFVATSLFQSLCVHTCLSVSNPIADASMYTCSWAMSAKSTASWEAGSKLQAITEPWKFDGLSSSMTNDLLVQSMLDLSMQQWNNNEAACYSSMFAKGRKEVNAVAYLISILKCHQDYSAKTNSGCNIVCQQSTEQNVGCGQNLW